MALLRARESVMRGFRGVIRQHGLSEQQWRVIRALHETERLEIGALAEKTFILKPSLTRILRDMVGRGLLARTQVAGDQRRAHVALTKKGRALFDRIAPESEAEYARIAERFGAAETARLYDLLSRLTHALETEEGSVSAAERHHHRTEQ